MDGRFPKWQLQHVVAAVALTATVAFIVTATWRRRSRAKPTEKPQKCFADDTSQSAELKTELCSAGVARDSRNHDSKPTCKLKHTDTEISNLNSESKDKNSVVQQGKPSLSSPRERHKEEKESISISKGKLSFALRNFKISPILTRCLKEFETRPMDATEMIDKSVAHLKSLVSVKQAIKSSDGGEFTYNTCKLPGHNRTVKFLQCDEDPSVHTLPKSAPRAIKYAAGKNETDESCIYRAVEMDNTEDENDSPVRSENYYFQQVSVLRGVTERQKSRGDNSETLGELCLNTKDSDSDEQYFMRGETYRKPRINLSEVLATDSFGSKPASPYEPYKIFCVDIETSASQVSKSGILTSMCQNFSGPEAHEFLKDVPQQNGGSPKKAGNILKISEFDHQKFRYEHKDTENGDSSSHDKASSPQNEVDILENSLKDADTLAGKSLNSWHSNIFTENTDCSSTPGDTLKTDTSRVPCSAKSRVHIFSSELYCNVNNSSIDHVSQTGKTSSQDCSQATIISETDQPLVSENKTAPGKVNVFDSSESTHVRDLEVNQDLGVKYGILETCSQDFSQKCSELFSKYSDDTVLNTNTSSGTSLQNTFSNLHCCDDPLYISRSVDDLNIRRFLSVKDFSSLSNRPQWTLKDSKRRKCYSCLSLIEISSYETGQTYHLTSRNDKTLELPFSLYHGNANDDKDSNSFFQENFTRFEGISHKADEESFNKTNSKHHALINRERNDLTSENSLHLFLNATEPCQDRLHYIQHRRSISCDRESNFPQVEENWDPNNSLTLHVNLQRAKFLSRSEENLSETTTEYFSLSNKNLSEENKQCFFSCSEDLSQDTQCYLSLSEGNLSQASSEYFSFSEDSLAEGWQQSSVFEGYASDHNSFQQLEYDFAEQKEQRTAEENENISKGSEKFHIIPSYSELSESKIYSKKESRADVQYAESFPFLDGNSVQYRAQGNNSQFSTDSLLRDCSRNETPTEQKNGRRISTSVKAEEQQCSHIHCHIDCTVDCCDAINDHSKHHNDVESNQKSPLCLSKTPSENIAHGTAQSASSECSGRIIDCMQRETDENAEVNKNGSFKSQLLNQSAEVYFPTQFHVETLHVSEKYPGVSEAGDNDSCSDYTAADLGKRSRKTHSLSEVCPSNGKSNNEKEQCTAFLGASTVSKAKEENEKCTEEHNFGTNCVEIRTSPKSVIGVSSEGIQVNSCRFTQKPTLEGEGGGYKIVNESSFAFKPLCVHPAKHTLTWGEEGGGGVPERDSTKARGQHSRMVNGGPPEVNNRREFPSNVISCSSPREEKSAADHASIGGGQGSAADEIWSGGRNLQLQIVTNSPVPLRQQLVIGDDHCRNSSCIAHEHTLSREAGISAPTPIGATRHVRCSSGHPEKLDADGQRQTSCGVHHHSVACRPESLTAECSIESSDSSEQRHTVPVASQSPLTSCLDYSSVQTDAAPVSNISSCSLNFCSKGDPLPTVTNEFQNGKNSRKDLYCINNNLKKDEKLTSFEIQNEEEFARGSVNNRSHLGKSESVTQGTITRNKETLSQNSSDILPAVHEKFVTWNNRSVDYSAKFVQQVSKLSDICTPTVSLSSHVKFQEDYPFTKPKARGKFDFCSVSSAKCVNIKGKDACHQLLNEAENNLLTENSQKSDFVLGKTRVLDSKLLRSSVSEENLNKKIEAIFNEIKGGLEISILKLKSDYFSTSKEFEFLFENYIACLKKDFQVTNEKLKDNYIFSVDHATDLFRQHVDKINKEINRLIAELGEYCEVRAAELTDNYRLSVTENLKSSLDKLNGVKDSLDEVKETFNLFIHELKNTKTVSDAFTDNFCTFLLRTEIQLGKSSEKLQEDIEILSKLLNKTFDFNVKAKDKSDIAAEKIIFSKSKVSAGVKIKIKKNPGKYLSRKKYGILELKSRKDYILLKSKCGIRNFRVWIAKRLKVMEETSRIANPRLLGLLDRNRERQARLHYLSEISQEGTPTVDENKGEKTSSFPTSSNDSEAHISTDGKAVDWNFQNRLETDVKNQRSSVSPEEFLVTGEDEKPCDPKTSVTEQVDTEELYNSNLRAISEAIEHMQDLISKDQAKRESIVLDEEKDHMKLSEAGTFSSEDWDALMRDVLSHVSSLEEWMKSEGGGGGAAKEGTLGLGPNLGEVTKASAGWRDATVRRSPEEFAETSAVVTKESRSPCDARSFRGSEMDVCEVEPSSPEILQASDLPLKPPTKVKNLRFKLDPDVYDFPSENGHDEDAAPHHRSKSSRHVWFAPQQPKYQAFSSLDLGRNTEPVKVVSVRTSVVPAGQKMVVKPIGFAAGGQRSSDDVKESDLPRSQSAEPQIKVKQLDIDLRIRLETENGEIEAKDFVNGNRRPNPDRQTKRAFRSSSPSQAKRRSPVYEHSRRVESSPERIDWGDVWTSVSIETNGGRESPSNNPFKEIQMCDLSEDRLPKEQSPFLVSKATHAEEDQMSGDTGHSIPPNRLINDENLSDSTTSSRPDNTPVKTPRKHLYVPKKKKFVPDPEAIERITGYKTAVSVTKPPLPPLPPPPVISSSYRLITGAKSRTDSARKRYFDSKALLTARNADGSFRFEQFLTEAQKDRSRLVNSTPDLAAIEVAVKQQWSQENRGSNNELDREMREESPSEAPESPDTMRRRRSSTPDDVWMSYVQQLRKQLNRRSRSLGYLETDLDACLAEDKVRSTLTLDQTESAPRSLTPGPSGSKFEKNDVNFSELGRAKSEHELRIERSLQNLSLPEWYRHSNRPKTGFLLSKKHEEKKGWAAVKSLTSSTTSLASSSGTAAVTTRPRRPVRSLRTSRENLTWSRGSASPSGVESNYVTKSSGPSLSLALARAFRDPYMGWRARTPSSCASPSPQPDLSPPSWGGGADLTERSDTPLTSDLPTMDEETTAESLEEPFGDIDYITENGMSPLMHSARDETCEDIKNMSLDTIEIHAPVTNGHHVVSVTHDDTCDDIDNLTMDTFELFDPISNGEIKAALLTSEEDVCENIETNNDTAENGDTGFQSSLMLEDTCDDIPNLSTDTSDNIPLVISVENVASPVPTSRSCPGSCEKEQIVLDSPGYQPHGINGNRESPLITSSETDDVHIVNGKLNGTTNYEKPNSEVCFRKVSKDNKNKEDSKQKRYSYNQSIYHSELHDPPHDEIRELSPAADINGSSQSIPSDSSGSSKVIWIESSFVGSRTTTSIVVLPVEDEKGKDRCYGNQENTGSNPSVGRPASR